MSDVRRIADALERIARSLEASNDVAPLRRRTARAKARRLPEEMARLVGERGKPTEMDAARARRALRKAGIR